MSDATVEITDVFAEASRCPASELRPGDTVFDIWGRRYVLTRVTHHTRNRTVTITRQDGSRSRFGQEEIITRIPGGV